MNSLSLYSKTDDYVPTAKRNTLLKYITIPKRAHFKEDTRKQSILQIANIVVHSGGCDWNGTHVLQK